MLPWCNYGAARITAVSRTSILFLFRRGVPTLLARRTLLSAIYVRHPTCNAAATARCFCPEHPVAGRNDTLSMRVDKHIDARFRIAPFGSTVGIAANAAIILSFRRLFHRQKTTKRCPSGPHAGCNLLECIS